MFSRRQHALRMRSSVAYRTLLLWSRQKNIRSSLYHSNLVSTLGSSFHEEENYKTGVLDSLPQIVHTLGRKRVLYMPRVIFGVMFHSTHLTVVFRTPHRQVRVQNEQFIELFDTDLVHLPPEAPPFVNR